MKYCVPYSATSGVRFDLARLGHEVPDVDVESVLNAFIERLEIGEVASILGDKLNHLSERLDGALEANGLWDGS